ncbi:MAG: disulfide bond formation protein B [Candidatus Campbellbacteria bacterium]|nr:disulfide bond formation protein B [Candidatus Campbellbacteria bacterium]
METIPYPIINTLIMLGIAVLQVASLTLLLGLLNVRGFSSVVSFVRSRGMTISFLILFASFIGSLYYSEIAGFPACSLCWYQRILLYPQLILFGAALWKGRQDVFLYTNTLSAVGLCIALYNIAIQTFQTVSTFCDPGGLAVSCLQKYVIGYGYITIPVMSATAFALLLLIGWAMSPKMDK